MWGIFLRTLTWRKIRNAVINEAAFRISNLIRRPVMWGMPVTLGVEPTTACNLRCPMCVSGTRSFTRPVGRLRPELFRKLIDQTAPDLAYLVFYFQGEPFIHPEFTDMVRYAADRNVFVATSSNAHFFDDETAEKTVLSGLGKLVVSIDGLSPETYERYRVGGDFHQAVEGVRTLVETKRRLRSATPFIELQFIVFSHNEDEIGRVKAFGKQLGVDRTVLKSAQIYDFEQQAKFLPRDERYKRYRDGKLKGRPVNRCRRLWRGAEITWDGRVVPCCFDKNADYVAGFFPQNSMRDIWLRSPAYREFRQSLLRGRKNIPICQNCTEGLKPTRVV
jgi:MoaA/NifB/PqqE/SkfB family radical SAM enzyme